MIHVTVPLVIEDHDLEKISKWITYFGTGDSYPVLKHEDYFDDRLYLIAEEVDRDPVVVRQVPPVRR